MGWGSRRLSMKAVRRMCRSELGLEACMLEACGCLPGLSSSARHLRRARGFHCAWGVGTFFHLS